MIRYLAVALALKAFSLTPQTKNAYRFLGNRIGARKRMQSALPTHYVNRTKWFLGLFEKYNISRHNVRMLELGTGWVHWDSTALRLFYDGRFTLFDVWDNRQFEPFQAYFTELHRSFEQRLAAPPAQRQQAMDLLSAITQASSFDQVYNLLGFEYIVEPAGTLHRLSDESFDVCFSCNVFEHISAAIAPGYIQDLHRLLKPGGYSIHNIDIGDHLAHFDRAVDRKNYLRYSDAAWRAFFQNDVQYFNRIQRSEWLKLFADAGFELLEEDPVLRPVGVPIHDKYKSLERKDIDCTLLRVVHRKPG